MKYRYIFMLPLVLIMACKNQSSINFEEGKNTTTIDGKLSNGSDVLITLDMMGSTEFIPIDSVRCDQDGNFKLSFESEGMNFYALKYTVDGYVTVIANGGDRIHLKGDAEGIYPYEIKGSKASELVRQLAVNHKNVLDQLSRISKETYELAQDEEYREKKLALNRAYDSLTKEFHDYSLNFIHEHATSPAVLIALYNQYGPENPVFHPIDDFEIYRFADSSLYANYPENEAVKMLHDQLTAALQKTKNLHPSKTLSVGMTAPDFVLDTPEGKKLTLSEFRGKYVLLQIWAAWSKPSVEENIFLKSCHEEFDDENFEILQVSIDNDRNLWTKTIHDQELNWYHCSDLQWWESVIVNIYKVEKIPANYLINPAGKIIEINKFGAELSPAIRKHIH